MAQSGFFDAQLGCAELVHSRIFRNFRSGAVSNQKAQPVPTLRLDAMFRLARLIDWDRFDAAFGWLDVDKAGRPGLQIRLVAGLPLLRRGSNWIGPTGQHQEEPPTASLL